MNQCTAIDLCAPGNADCTHICRVNYSLSFPYKECACHQNFKLAPDGKTCQNKFCEEQPHACGDNTTVCKTIETTDHNKTLYKCEYFYSNNLK